MLTRATHCVCFGAGGGRCTLLLNLVCLASISTTHAAMHQNTIAECFELNSLLLSNPSVAFTVFCCLVSFLPLSSTPCVCSQCAWGLLVQPSAMASFPAVVHPPQQATAAGAHVTQGLLATPQCLASWTLSHPVARLGHSLSAGHVLPEVRADQGATTIQSVTAV